MKKATKTMMIMGAIGMCGIGAYMYNKNTKKALKKYKAYLEN